MKFLKSVSFERYVEDEPNFNLENYSEKLDKKAINIFAVNFNCDIAHLAFYLTSSSLFVSSLSVLPSWRKLGIGSELLKICATIATSMERKKIELETSRNNVEAINFYNKNGFEVNNLEGSKRLALSKLVSQPI